jgi:hypothetical protein
MFWDRTPCSPFKSTDVSEEHIAPIFSLCLPPTFTMVPCSAYPSVLKMETICPSETSVDTQQTTRSYIPEDGTLYNHRCENLKSYLFFSGRSNSNYETVHVSQSVRPTHISPRVSQRASVWRRQGANRMLPCLKVSERKMSGFRIEIPNSWISSRLILWEWNCRDVDWMRQSHMTRTWKWTWAPGLTWRSKRLQVSAFPGLSNIRELISLHSTIARHEEQI